MANQLQTTEEPSLASLVSGILADAQNLIKQQFSLVRTEIIGELRQARNAAISFGVGAGIAAAGAIFVRRTAWSAGWSPISTSKKLQVRYILAENHEDHRQGRGKHQPNGSPEPSPECGRDQQGHLRDAHAPPIKQRLHHIVADQFQDQEQADHQDRFCPSRKHDPAQSNRGQGRDPRPHVGNVTEHRGQQAPEKGVRDADKVQPDAHGDAEGAVDDELHEQVAADALSGIVEGTGRKRQPATSHHPNQAVPQVLALDEHEQHQHNHQAGTGERFEQRFERGP